VAKVKREVGRLEPGARSPQSGRLRGKGQGRRRRRQKATGSGGGGGGKSKKLAPGWCFQNKIKIGGGEEGALITQEAETGKEMEPSGELTGN